MTSPWVGPWQHDVILQSLYSSKSFGDKALYFKRSLAQARADVFFALVFGATIKSSAASFLDSSIAIRVFGELFSHKDVDMICDDYNWVPLILNTDGTEKISPENFLLKRWQNPNGKFAIFREFDNDDLDASLDSVELKKSASNCLSNGNFGTLNLVLQKLFEEYEVLHDELTSQPAIQSFLRCEAILQDGAGYWFKNILSYLKRPGAFQTRLDVPNPTIINSFTPQDAIKRRSNSIGTELFGPYRKTTLLSLNEEFEKKLKGTAVMNPFFTEAQKHYGRYYPLIAHWVEADWHGLRHKMYGSATLVASSDWTLLDIFGFDNSSRVYYDSEDDIDDSLAVQHEDIIEFDWSSLFSIMKNTRWHDAIRSIKCGENIASNVELVFDLVARAQTSFTFSLEKDRVTIAAKRSAAIGTSLGIFGHFHSTLPGLLGTDLFGLFASAPAAAVLAKDGISIAKVSSPGLKYLHKHFLKMAMRRAVVSRFASNRK